MPKRRRVLADFPADMIPNLLHQGGVTMQGLAKVIAALQGTDTSGPQWDRIGLGDVNQAMFHRTKCVDVVRMLSGNPWPWEYIDPCKLLTVLLTESVGLQALYDGAWARSPATPQTPWSLLVAFDEFSPGNKLATDQTRKEDYGTELHIPRARRLRPCPREGLVHTCDRPHKHNHQGAARNLSVPVPCSGT